MSYIMEDKISWNKPRDVLEGTGSLTQKKEEELALLKLAKQRI